MSSTTMAKVTSLGSHSGASTVPNPTPATEAQDSEFVDQPPTMDFGAVAKILAPIMESLNESAEEAMLPSPPINTPVMSSPTPSVKHCLPTRVRGFSVVGDRLAQLKIDNSRFRNKRDTDSNRSIEPSLSGECDDSEITSTSEVMSDSGRERLDNHASTPLVNPLIEEYQSFDSKIMPARPASAAGTTLAENVSSTSADGLDEDSLRRTVSFKSDGVTEKSNWAEELEDSFERTCLRLEQLARDEFASNAIMSMEDYYINRLNRLLGHEKRSVRVTIEKIVDGVE